MNAAEAAPWALAFTLLPWTEDQKARLWARVEAGEPRASLEALGQGRVGRALETLEAELPRRREEARERGARLLLPGEEGVEALLEELPYPVALWVRGSLPPLGRLAALVGSRHATVQGRCRARSWARELTVRGLGVISGLARGIDAAAHQGALEAGPTWGVMGSGLDQPYPPEHRDLMDRVVGAGGGVLTPFPPETPPLGPNFPRRNWLLAAWSLGVLVLEARIRSGSLVTARLALDLGKELWVCPGCPEEPLAQGPNALLREGAARICRSPSDLLEDLGDGWAAGKGV